MQKLLKNSVSKDSRSIQAGILVAWREISLKIKKETQVSLVSRLGTTKRSPEYTLNWR